MDGCVVLTEFLVRLRRGQVLGSCCAAQGRLIMILFWSVTGMLCTELLLRDYREKSRVLRG